MNNYKLKKIIAILGKELGPFFCESIEIENGFIKKIQKVRKVSTAQDSNLVMIPGLWNGHTHLGDSAVPDGATGLTLEEGFFWPDGFKHKVLRETSPEILQKNMEHHLCYMFNTGTVGHIDFREQGQLGCELLKETSRKSKIRSIILGRFRVPPFNKPQLHSNQAGLNDDNLEELRNVLNVADGFAESTMNDLTDVAWQQIKEFTNKKNKLRAVHCLESENYRESSKKITGRGDLERALDLYGPDLIVHMTVANDEEICLAKNSRASFVLNPRANANLGLPLPPIAGLLDAGLNLLLGTDNVMLNSPNMFAELDFTYKVCKSQYQCPTKPHPKDILKMATSNIGNLFKDKYYGYLDEGLPADYVLIDFSKQHLKPTGNLLATIITRVTPDDIISTNLGGGIRQNRNQ